MSLAQCGDAFLGLGREMAFRIAFLASKANLERSVPDVVGAEMTDCRMIQTVSEGSCDH